MCIVGGVISVGSSSGSDRHRLVPSRLHVSGKRRELLINYCFGFVIFARSRIHGFIAKLPTYTECSFLSVHPQPGTYHYSFGAAPKSN